MFLCAYAFPSSIIMIRLMSCPNSALLTYGFSSRKCINRSITASWDTFSIEYASSPCSFIVINTKPLACLAQLLTSVRLNSGEGNTFSQSRFLNFRSKSVFITISDHFIRFFLSLVFVGVVALLCLG